MTRRGNLTLLNIGMGNNPVSGVDPTGGLSFGGIWDSVKGFFAKTSTWAGTKEFTTSEVAIVGQRLAPALRNGSEHSLIGIFGRSLGVLGDAMEAPGKARMLAEQRRDYFKRTVRDSYIQDEWLRHNRFSADRSAFRDNRVIMSFEAGGLINPAGAELAVAKLEGVVTKGAGPVLKITTQGGEVSIQNGMSVTSSHALELAEDFLGKGYYETGAGSGRYISQDGTRVFRMGNDELGKATVERHVNFETLTPSPDPRRLGKLRPTSKVHLGLLD